MKKHRNFVEGCIRSNQGEGYLVKPRQIFNLHFNFENVKVAQQLKALASKSGNLSSIPQAQLVGSQTWVWKAVILTYIHTYTEGTHTHKHILINITFLSKSGGNEMGVYLTQPKFICVWILNKISKVKGKAKRNKHNYIMQNTNVTTLVYIFLGIAKFLTRCADFFLCSTASIFLTLLISVSELLKLII